jgi:Fur family transcriptional regulator, ferric uptake regulator
MDNNYLKDEYLQGQLRDHGFRITEGRIKLLKLLYTAREPLSIQAVSGLWKGKQLNQTTLYRTLTDLTEAGIVRRVDLNTGTAHFEYTPDRPHHHHIICSDCGTIENIDTCFIGGLQEKLTQDSKRFKNIYSHNLEFFGHCKSCTKA